MNKIFQVSTLQALIMGYSKKVMKVKTFMEKGTTGLGTFTDVGGEMICVDGRCYCADENGNVKEANWDDGVSFAAVEPLKGDFQLDINKVENINDLSVLLNNEIDSNFGLNSMWVVRIDAKFDEVYARSESSICSQHVELKDILSKAQKSFKFENVSGSIICLYFPEFMQGINAAGWHFHFVSDDRKSGGHVFDVKFKNGKVTMDKVDSIEIKLPKDASFDTYTLSQPSEEEIKKVEQSDK